MERETPVWKRLMQKISAYLEMTDGARPRIQGFLFQVKYLFLYLIGDAFC